MYICIHIPVFGGFSTLEILTEIVGVIGTVVIFGLLTRRTISFAAQKKENYRENNSR